MRKILIAYFSRADENYFGGAMRYIKVGNTEIVVNLMKKMIDTDVFKIEMETPYASDYNTCIKEAQKDLKSGIRPKLKANMKSIDKYETVIIAYPNYWGTVPVAVMSFMEQFNWTGKTILPLCTNEGSDMGFSETDIQQICEGATLKKGLSINGSRASESANEVKKWLEANA